MRTGPGSGPCTGRGAGARETVGRAPWLRRGTSARALLAAAGREPWARAQRAARRPRRGCVGRVARAREIWARTGAGGGGTSMRAPGEGEDAEGPPCGRRARGGRAREPGARRRGRRGARGGAVGRRRGLGAARWGRGPCGGGVSGREVGPCVGGGGSGREVGPWVGGDGSGARSGRASAAASRGVRSGRGPGSRSACARPRAWGGAGGSDGGVGPCAGRGTSMRAPGSGESGVRETADCGGVGSARTRGVRSGRASAAG